MCDVAQTSHLEWEDHMYGNEPEARADGSAVHSDPNAPQEAVYNRSPVVDSAENSSANYNLAPSFDRPGRAEAGTYEEVPNRSAPGLGGRIARLFRSSLASRREAFARLPIPAPDAKPKVRAAYLKAAEKAGYDITQEDLESFGHDVSQEGAGPAIRQALSTPLPGGEGVLGAILMKQNPEIAERERFNIRARYDDKESVRPEASKDLEYDAVFGNEARFDAAMGRIKRLKPLSAKATFEQFDTVQKAFREVGVRLTVSDFQTYAANLKANGASALQRPGADEGMTLGQKMLVDMQRSPADRALIGASAERWGHMLARNPQIPAREEKWNKLPAQNWVGDALAPTGPQAENPYSRSPQNENPYGQRIPAPSATIVRDGVAQTMPPGYNQDGKIVAIDDGAVFQATRAVRSEAGTGIETVRYDLADITKAMPREQLESAMEQGHVVSVRAQGGDLEVVDLDAQEQSLERSPELSMEVDR
jgi:hypothetical protein